FSNVVDFVPAGSRGFFETAFWIRDHQPTSLAWDTVAKIRQRWKRKFIIKGLLREDDVRRALDAGVDGIVLGTHGGRQLDWCVSALDVLPGVREIVPDRIALYVTGGVRRGTDLLKALSLGADAVLAGRAPLYGLCAGGEAGVKRALDLLAQEAVNALGLLGASGLGQLGPQFLRRLDARSRGEP
ncbi:MAG TPA: alpha-hydroxy acid oxidase, partial [Ramlibacter sp.]